MCKVRSVGSGVKRELYERVVVSTVAYGTEIRCMRNEKRRKLLFERRSRVYSICAA